MLQRNLGVALKKLLKLNKRKKLAPHLFGSPLHALLDSSRILEAVWKSLTYISYTRPTISVQKNCRPGFALNNRNNIDIFYIFNFSEADDVSYPVILNLLAGLYWMWWRNLNRARNYPPKRYIPFKLLYISGIYCI